MGTLTDPGCLLVAREGLTEFSCTQLCGFPAPLLPQGQTLSYHLRWSQSLSGNTGQAGAAQRGCKPRTEHRTRSAQG